MSRFTPIDLDKLPPPDVVEALSYEQILADMRADLVAKDPSFSALLESDPAIKVLEVAAYREMVLRQRVNDAGRAVMLASAQGADLDNLGAFYGVERLVVDPGDDTAIPPRPRVMESHDRYRQRIQLALEGFSTAGPAGAYEFHSLSASGLVKDVDVASPSPSTIVVTILSTIGDGTPSAELLATVEAALADEDVRPLGDRVTVEAAEIVPYQVEAVLTLYRGPDAEVVRQAAQAQLASLVAARHRLGEVEVPESALKAALHVAGVQKVTLVQPAAGVTLAAGQAAYCTTTTITTEVANG
ncbi:MAG: baseplate J/gp47 family protein [Magnetospirillum sp.]|nr:baseplate J/gp47 family protein [Magnetospirillum sp.]